MNFLEIINSWVISFNPTPTQKNQALERLNICDKCDKRELGFFKTEICGGCGCPLSKKVFSKSYNSCPLKKWESVDLKYIPKPTNEKVKKTIL